MTARRARSVEGFVLQAMLLAGIVAAPLGSVALFLPADGMRAGPERGRPYGGSSWP